ncbi:gamma-glutamyl-gamma-aminobutyrate hydrolase family protein [Massilia sp. P8910]|uniref:gamma-glutamyl-gamma-aminobutyrate hydrolase family protein n=1 Tax=Massilia antarctica TaxID=2765360 RepID=UPI001E359F4B|nr:gamma-glutamyl-gamma-aminobutyrate hydrolase family protein [Massilia antarctica]MCE3603596.1 gamma-glutamyl-gamma-aminobutyrate hydrolase family protein [Massilia antarctica]
MRRPIVLVPACTRQIGPHPYHAAQLKYVDAVVLGADCAPMILPALGAALDLEASLSVCDGIMLTGSASNVHPSYYDQDVLDPSLPQDRARDATTLPMIRAALERGIPLIAVCRGFQEMNVALGGSLYQAVQEVEGKMDHREDPDASIDDQYGPAHDVILTQGGAFQRMLGGVERIAVNSLHGQGVDRLAPGIAVEAVSHDGLVEAFSVPSAPGFTLAVQWHPEWQILDNPASMAMFGAFGQACRAFQARREGRA